MSVNQWRSNRGFSRFKEPGPPTVRGPDHGHNLFYYFILFAIRKKTEFKRNQNPLVGFLKDVPCLLTAFIFMFSKTLTDKKLCNNYGFATFVNKYSDAVSDDQCSL